MLRDLEAVCRSVGATVGNVLDDHNEAHPNGREGVMGYLGSMNDIAADIHRENRAKGWDVPMESDWQHDHRIPTFLALIHSEVSEALEGFRAGDRANVAEELADVVIRVFDLAHGLGIDIEREVSRKRAKNLGRPQKHGGKRI